MNKYKSFGEVKKDGFIGEYTAYGIRAYGENDEVVGEVSDAFVNKADADKFADVCNSNQLSPIHLKDVLYDFI